MNAKTKICCGFMGGQKCRNKPIEFRPILSDIIKSAVGREKLYCSLPCAARAVDSVAQVLMLKKKLNRVYRLDTKKLDKEATNLRNLARDLWQLHREDDDGQ